MGTWTPSLAGTVKTTAVAVTNAATALPSSILTSRRLVRVRVDIDAAEAVYIGGSDVSTANGYPLGPGETSEWFPLGTAALYGRTASGSVNVRVMEISDS